MSADNYLYVGKTPDGKFGYEMRFASFAAEYPALIDPDTAEPKFDTADEAVKAAYLHEADNYYEYGVHIAPEVLKDWAA